MSGWVSDVAVRDPRGIRLNNPGLLRVNPANKWQGRAAPHERSAAQALEREFEVFLTPEWGIRAMAVLLTNYYDHHGLRTVRGIISRWAPSTENNVEAYVASVCQRIEEYPDAHLNLHDYAVMRSLVLAIIRHENGVQPYSEAVIRKGLAMAGFVAPEQTPAKSGTVVSGVTTAASTAGTLALVLSDGARDMQDVLQPFATMETVKYILITLSVASALLTVWMRVREHKRMV